MRETLSSKGLVEVDDKEARLNLKGRRERGGKKEREEGEKDGEGVE